MNHLLITGGAGFVGANLAIYLKERFPHLKISTLDNLSRRGSELNVPRLREASIEFRLGDIRNREDLDQFKEVDVIVDAAAEPSVLSGIKGDPRYVVEVNFLGTINCLELARKNQARFIYLSTNRVYSYPVLNSLGYIEQDSRFEFSENQEYLRQGIGESFDTNGLKSFYGASKLASEHFILEYAHHFQLKSIINRFGVIAGPWQMGKADQGFLSLWVTSHYFGKPLKYLGFGGRGKQVRDILHIHDLCRLISLQLASEFQGESEIFNVGGGWSNSISLMELTRITEKIVGNKIPFTAEEQTRPADVRIYYSNYSRVNNFYQWIPEKSVTDCVADTWEWVRANEIKLQKIFNR